MSAFVVSKAHIDTIVALANAHGLGLSPRATLDDIGRALLLENLRSVEAVCPETKGNAADMPGNNDEADLRADVNAYTYAPPRKQPTALEGIKLVKCYEYQSNNHKAWIESAASSLVDSLIGALIRALPGYSAAAWEV